MKEGANIRSLLSRCITSWKQERFDDLIFEFEHCVKKLNRRHFGRTTAVHMIKVFSRLMWRGQVRSAVRWLTERKSHCGVLDPNSMVDDKRTVFDVLKEKHPGPAQPVESAFESCEELPPILDIDITSAYVEKVAMFCSFVCFLLAVAVKFTINK